MTSTRNERPAPPIVRWLTIGVVSLVIGFWSLSVVLGTVNAVRDSYHGMKQDVTVKNDFPMFYAGTENVVSADRGQTYNKQFIIDSILGQWSDPESETAQGLVPLLRYYNPPFYLLALSPLTLLDMHTAFLVIVLINAVLLGVLLVLVGVALQWRKVPTFLISLATIGFVGVPTAIYNGQPTILIAILVMAAYLLMHRGRSTLAAMLLAVCAAKPHLAVAAALPVLRQKPQTVVPLAMFAAALTLVPFALLGFGALMDYVSLIFGRGGDDLADSNYTYRVLSWPGFFAALTGSSQPLAAIAMSLITLGLLVIVLREGDRFLIWPASMMALLSVLPHSHAQDWLIAVPAVVILLLRPMDATARAVTIGLLAIGYVAINSWLFEVEVAGDGGRAFYAPAPFVLLLLGWLAALPVLERRSANQPAAIGSKASAVAA